MNNGGNSVEEMRERTKEERVVNDNTQMFDATLKG